ncbi:ankyrin-like protein/NFkB inhibitor [Yokapox virus]|uniref:Ankyrin-like protein/NFkB inhibitor n=1 Tax=Yokapox virus TaxID=1076255 RepID=G3EI61_9POXV|nr:ankyrin-like protein/NFkB inhibitor [Yokapox virus]AEN03758.1 ankyrin-like protein/NFkB inhibitor [Yokapox virus]
MSLISSDISTVSSWSIKKLKQFVRSNNNWYLPDKNGINILEYAVKSEKIKLVTTIINILPYCDIKIPIHDSVKTGNKELIKTILYIYNNHELDLDDKGNVPLYYAVEIGNIDIIKLFDSKAMFYGNDTPFNKAVNDNKIHIVEYFIYASNYSLKCLDYIWTAIDNNNLDITRLLLSSYKSYTNCVLQHVIDKNMYEILEMLLYEFNTEIYPFNLSNCKCDKSLKLLISEYLWRHVNNLEETCFIKKIDNVYYNKCKEELYKANDLITLESVNNIYNYISIVRNFSSLDVRFPIYHKRLLSIYNVGLEKVEKVYNVINFLYNMFNCLPVEICETIIYNLDFLDIRFFYKIK